MWGHRIAVIGGGAIGEAFWLVSQFVYGSTYSASALVCADAIGGGAIAAGFAIYVSADFLDKSKLEKMFFFSIAAGLSFPSILSTISNAKDIAQIHSTNRQVQQSVQTVQQQISSPGGNPAKVAQEIKQAGTALSVNPASPDVKLSYDAVSKTAISSLSAKATNAKNPADYVGAIAQIGTVPQFHFDAASKLAELSNSSNVRVSAAAKPALERLTEGTTQLNTEVEAATSNKSHP